MLLAIDIGNTNINFALIGKNGKITDKHLMRTDPFQPGRLDSACWDKAGIDKIIVASVVPEVLDKIKKHLRNRFKEREILVAGKDLKVPIKCAYNRKQIGQDRLITAFAAKSLYGLPILIVDFGTAVTFDAVSKKSVYLGGLILPGIKMSLESLSERTAMLPETYLKKTSTFIGRNTTASIRNGMIYGYASICEGLVKRFQKELGRDLKIVATGGDAPLISKYAPHMKKIEQDLSLKGLYLLSEM